MSRAVRSVIAALVLCTLALAQTDKAGSKDHPLFTRMPGYVITEYSDREFDAETMLVAEKGKPVRTTIEGHAYRLSYGPAKGTAPVSPLQVVRNYMNAAKAIGGETLFENTFGAPAATMRIVKDGSEYWANVEAYPLFYRVRIVAKQAMKQDVVADAASFARDLGATGKVAVYGIYFDTAKADLKPASDVAIAEIAKLLKQEPSLRLFVVGHTDTVGEPAMNLKLSQARAQSVVSALTTKHAIPASRLLSFGAGPYAPVASNKDETGRAKNRRVELVDMAGK